MAKSKRLQIKRIAEKEGFVAGELITRSLKILYVSCNKSAKVFNLVPTHISFLKCFSISHLTVILYYMCRGRLFCRRELSWLSELTCFVQFFAEVTCFILSNT